jgi:hypothetical protein
MKTNLVDLMSKVSQLESEFTELSYELQNQSMNVTIIELDGQSQDLEFYPYFKDDFDRYIELGNEITRLKGIIFERNNSLKLKNGNTIQKTIAEIQNKRKVLNLVKRLAKQNPSKKRTSETNNSYFTSRELAYDKDMMVDLQNKLTTEIQDLELEISQLNAETFEI